jgi:hypothetical protein
MVSGMHIQAPQMHDIAARAKAAGKVTVLGGASVSGAPEPYPDFDYPGAVERDTALRRLSERAVLTRMLCRELLEAKGRFASARRPRGLSPAAASVRAAVHPRKRGCRTTQ